MTPGLSSTGVVIGPVVAPDITKLPVVGPQLSVALIAGTVYDALQGVPGMAVTFRVVFGGQVTTGDNTSITNTWLVQVAELPKQSVTVSVVTTVCGHGCGQANALGLRFIDTMPQLSKEPLLTSAGCNITGLMLPMDTWTFLQLATGGVLSTTFTEVVQVLVLPLRSTTVSTTT